MFAATRMGLMAMKGGPTLPQVVGRQIYADAAASTSHTIPLPSGIQAGDLLIAVLGVRLGDTGSASGWTDVVRRNYGTSFYGSVYKRIATGSDTLIWTDSTNRYVSGVTLCIRNASTCASSSSGASSSSSTAPTVSLTSHPFVCIAAAIVGITKTISNHPSGYSDPTRTDYSTLRCDVYTVEKHGLTGTSESPGTWTYSGSTAYVNFTLAAYQA